MTKPTTFRLTNEALKQDLGTIIFNGKFVFSLDSNISHAYWNQVGFIPLATGETRIESDDLFYYLNSRLPIALRKESSKAKLNYIKKSGLRVASDSLVLLPA
jgi:outer membrane lipoprotein-sorting protein